jgi:Na+/H+-translocating membrane pyrophosphatase
MKQIFAIILIAFSLGGCIPVGPSVPNPVTPTSLYDVKATYAIAQAGADTYVQRYRDGFRCTKTRLESVTNLCSRRSIVIKMQNADRVAGIALGQAETFIFNNPMLDATSVISAAQRAVTAFYQIQQGNP